MNNELSNWEMAILDEIQDVLNCNFDQFETGLDLPYDEKLNIAREVLSEYYFDNMDDFIARKINRRLKARYKMLIEKSKVCELDKSERHELENLIYYKEDLGL